MKIMMKNYDEKLKESGRLTKSKLPQTTKPQKIVKKDCKPNEKIIPKRIFRGLKK
jgi:hypothetical protein